MLKEVRTWSGGYSLHSKTVFYVRRGVVKI